MMHLIYKVHEKNRTDLNKTAFIYLLITCNISYTLLDTNVIKFDIIQTMIIFLRGTKTIFAEINSVTGFHLKINL